MKLKLWQWCACVVLFLCLVGWSGFLWQHQEIQTLGKEQVLRLHILANSDSYEDQRIKQLVRDAILSEFSQTIGQFVNRQESLQWINGHKTEILQVIRRVLAEQGANYDGQIEIGDFMFPIKTYGELVFPAGQYDAVRILLGKAEGQNWWCVLYPPLCFIDKATANATPVNIVQGINQENVEIRWKSIDWLKGLLEKD